MNNKVRLSKIKYGEKFRWLGYVWTKVTLTPSKMFCLCQKENCLGFSRLGHGLRVEPIK